MTDADMLETFEVLTSGDIFLMYVNDNKKIVVCRTDDHNEVIRLITENKARVIPFDSLLSCYEIYKAEESGATFSDWVIGEM